MPQEAINKAYQRLSEKFEMPPIEQFQESLKDQEGRRKAYDRLSQSFDMSEVPFETFDKDVSPETGIFSSAYKGFTTSNIGAALTEPQWKFQPANLSERIAMSGGKLVGDLPSMFAGGLLGTLGGLVTGPGAVISGGAGAFALPRAIEAVQRGETFQEALPEVGKSAALGALTAGTGAFFKAPLTAAEKALAQALKSGDKVAAEAARVAIKTAKESLRVKAAVPAEIGALTFGGAGLEGRLPTSDDIIEATALVYGLKFANSISGKIRGARSKAEQQLKSTKEPINIDEQVSAIQDLIKTEASKQGVTETPEYQAMKRTPEQLRQERIETEEIEAAISREKRQQALSAETEPLVPTRGAGGKFERKPTDVSSLKEAMAAAAEKSQQAEGLPEALKQTLSGLSELFKPGGELRSGVGFSEEAYQKAKPYFEKAFFTYRNRGALLWDSVKDIYKELGEPSVSYLERFLNESTSGVGHKFDKNDIVLGKFPEKFDPNSPITTAIKIPGKNKYVLGTNEQEHADLAEQYGIAERGIASEHKYIAGFVTTDKRFLSSSDASKYLAGRDAKDLSREAIDKIYSYKLRKEAGFIDAIQESLKGISELFKPGGELRSGVGFSEESYQKAKPHFQKAWEAYKDMGRSFASFVNDILEASDYKVAPYLLKYEEETVGKFLNSVPTISMSKDLNKNKVNLALEGINYVSRSYPRQFRLPSAIVLDSLGKDKHRAEYRPRSNSLVLNLDKISNLSDVVGNLVHEITHARQRLNKVDFSEYKSPDRESPSSILSYAVQPVELQAERMANVATNKLVGGETTYVSSDIKTSLSETIKGFIKLLDDSGVLKSGIGFSEESYQKSKPHFQAAWESYKKAGKSFSDFASEMLEKGGENLKPFLDQFQREQAAAIRQNLTQQTTERVNEASQSKPEERAPGVEDIKWLSRIVFTPQRAVSTKLSQAGKTNIEVNLDHPKAQDITYKVLEQDSKTSQTIQNEITHATNTEAEFYKGISRLPQGLSSRVYKAERDVAGGWLKRVISKPTELRNVPQEYRRTVTSLLAHYKLTDAQIKGDPDRGISSYQDLMEQAGANKAQINAGLKKFQLADIRFRTGNNIFRDFKSYLSFVTRHLSMDPVQVQIKGYMKEHPELFPSQIKQTIEEQLLVARGEKSWIEDRVVDGIWNWFGRSSYKGFTSFSQLSRRGQANLKLGYRPISAFVDLAHSVANTLIKREGQPFWQSLKRTADFMKSEEGKKFIKDEEEAGSLQIGLDVDYAGRPVPKEALWKPLGLRSESEVKQRQFALSFAYQNALSRGMSEPVAREYARRMLHLTQGTYVLSGMRQFMRAPISKTLFQFKEYIGRTFELMHTFSGREWAEYAAFNLAMSGPRGLVLFAKSIPMLALLGVLDKVEEALNTYKGIGKELVSGLPGAAGADVAAQATLQVAPNPEDAGGVLISDAIKVFKNFVLPVLGPGRYLTARALKEFGGDTIRSIVPEVRNLMDVWDSVVSQDGWVHNNEGKPVYQLNSGWDRALKVLGASNLEESKLKTAERLRVEFENDQKEGIRFLLRVASKDKLTGSDAQKAIQELGDLGIQSQSIENAFKQRLLDPRTRALLRSRLSQKARVLEFYDFE